MSHEERTEKYREQREAHYERLFGPMHEYVFHSTDIKQVHIDVYQFPPTKDRPYWTLITGGMSDERQLLLEPDTHRSPRAEIIMYVREPRRWMFTDMKILAEFPFDENTVLHWWHTVPIGVPINRQKSDLNAYFFLPPYFENPELSKLKIDGDGVDFLWMQPITEAERAFAQTKGSDKLEKVIRKANLPIVLNEYRKSLIRQLPFGLFFKR
ncbi:MAG: suppressor of fused domain protein [Phycisphaerales bacterium]